MTYLFLDLETTGLDPSRCRIIEIACTLKESLHGGSLLDYDRVIVPAPICHWDDAATMMHFSSGLGQAADSGVDLTDVDALFAELPHKTILVGNSIHFDRGFIKRWMPTLESRLHHRMIDVTSIALFHESVTGKTYAKKRAHRARSDLNETMAELAWLHERSL